LLILLDKKRENRQKQVLKTSVRPFFLYNAPMPEFLEELKRRRYARLQQIDGWLVK